MNGSDLYVLLPCVVKPVADIHKEQPHGAGSETENEIPAANSAAVCTCVTKNC